MVLNNTLQRNTANKEHLEILPAFFKQKNDPYINIHTCKTEDFIQFIISQSLGESHALSSPVKDLISASKPSSSRANVPV
jgi:hypothetical protein